MPIRGALRSPGDPAHELGAATSLRASALARRRDGPAARDTPGLEGVPRRAGAGPRLPHHPRRRDPRAARRERRRQVDARQDRRRRLCAGRRQRAPRRRGARATSTRRRPASSASASSIRKARLIAQLSVAENIFAGRQPTGWLGQVDEQRDARADRGASGAARRRASIRGRRCPNCRRPRPRSSRSPRRCRRTCACSSSTSRRPR